MKFTKSGGQTAVGPKDWFTGTVFIDGIRNADDQSAASSSIAWLPANSHTIRRWLCTDSRNVAKRSRGNTPSPILASMFSYSSIASTSLCSAVASAASISPSRR